MTAQPGATEYWMKCEIQLQSFEQAHDRLSAPAALCRVRWVICRLFPFWITSQSNLSSWFFPIINYAFFVTNQRRSDVTVHLFLSVDF
jgi:hypothetical protein